jgi:carboxypeptidase Taq
MALEWARLLRATPSAMYQFYAAALRAHAEIPQQMCVGEFGTLHGWLRENLYRQGRKFTPAETVQRATGESISVEPYLDYLRTKFGGLYALPGASAAR